MHDVLKVAGVWATFMTMLFLTVLIITTRPAEAATFAYVWAE